MLSGTGAGGMQTIASNRVQGCHAPQPDSERGGFSFYAAVHTPTGVVLQVLNTYGLYRFEEQWWIVCSVGCWAPSYCPSAASVGA